ncbi:MAG: peptidase M19 [Saprospiraceae bacterium]
MASFNIDLHCHPSIKPYGKSFNGTPGDNPSDKSKKNSLWYYDPPKGLDKIIQKFVKLTQFSQSNFSALAYGDVKIICASLYSIERGLVDLNFGGTSLAADILANFVSGIGMNRINFLQQNTDYYSDLVNEYEYYKKLDDVKITFRGEGVRKYVLVKNYVHLQELIALNEPNTEVETIYVIMTLEGAHNLHATRPAELASVLSNADDMKCWEHKPFFITFAHHFYNDFCGHAESFTDVIQDWLTNQEPFMNTGINAMGWEVLKKLIDNTDGTRIHIDIKHMSALSRKQYIEFLKRDHSEEYSQKQLPLIVSHGSCNGLNSMDNPNHTPGLESTATKMYNGEINFYDNEILELARSGGIFGLQLDERRIGSKQYVNEVHLTFASKTKRMHSNSKLIWNNIQHIVQLLDQHDLFAWDCIAMGTDNDGIIDPINLFWTAEEMDDLVQYIERHAFNFFSDPAIVLKNSFNKIPAAEVVDRIFYSNSIEFFRKYFK